MFTLLRHQPIEQAELWSVVKQVPWLHDYAPLCGDEWTAALVFEYAMAGFLERGTVVEARGLLESTVPK